MEPGAIRCTAGCGRHHCLLVRCAPCLCVVLMATCSRLVPVHMLSLAVCPCSLLPVLPSMPPVQGGARHEGAPHAGATPLSGPHTAGCGVPALPGWRDRSQPGGQVRNGKGRWMFFFKQQHPPSGNTSGACFTACLSTHTAPSVAATGILGQLGRRLNSMCLTATPAAGHSPTGMSRVHTSRCSPDYVCLTTAGSGEPMQGSPCTAAAANPIRSCCLHCTAG